MCGRVLSTIITVATAKLKAICDTDKDNGNDDNSG